MDKYLNIYFHHLHCNRGSNLIPFGTLSLLPSRTLFSWICWLSDTYIVFFLLKYTLTSYLFFFFTFRKIFFLFLAWSYGCFSRENSFLHLLFFVVFLAFSETNVFTENWFTLLHLTAKLLKCFLLFSARYSAPPEKCSIDQLQIAKKKKKEKFNDIHQ